MKLDQNLLEKLVSIPWFYKCGNPPPFEWAVSAASEKAALKAITSRKWENMILDTQGDITEQLSLRSTSGLGREYQEWNSLVNDFKKSWMPQLHAKWETALQHRELNTSDVLNDVSFNILSIAVIDAYKDIVPMPLFFRRVLEAYEAGWLPCGWKGNQETGKLIVY